MSYYINKIISTDFYSAIEKVTQQLKSEGFGVLTKIDVQDTLKKKIDIDFRQKKSLVLVIPQMHTKYYQTIHTLD